MKKLLFYLFFLAVLLAPAGAASAALPDGWTSQDIGGPGQPGSADEIAGTWTVNGSGADIWGTSDQFHFCYKQDSGDIEIIARVHPIGGGTHEWTKAGVMIRDTLNANSMHSFMARTNNTGTAHAFSAQLRPTTGGDSLNPADQTPGDYVATEPYWVKINRVGNSYTESISPDGITWNDRTTQTIAMTDPVYVGMAVTSHDNGLTMIGIFDSVKINGIDVGQCGASGPDPASGSFVPPEYYEPNVYMILDFTPGSCTEGYYSEGFFSTDKALVDAMDPSVSLGTVPPWPLIDDNAWVVGYDDPGIPEHARTPLVPGTTYYWSTASFDGTQWWPSATWSFTPIPPQVWGPYPADGAIRIPNDVTMTWHLGDTDPSGFALSYNVYIGTSETAVADANVVDNPLVAEFAGNVTTESYDFSDPDPAGQVEYFWRVDTKLTLTRPPFTSEYVEGDVWSFTTLPVPPVVPITDPNLVAHYKLDGDIVDYWIFDSSGYGNHGTPMSDLTYVPGNVDNALDLDGADDYVDCGADASLDIRNELTMACWFRVAAYTKTWETFAAKGDNSYRIGRGPGDGSATHFGLNGTTIGNFNGNSPVDDDEWHHMAGVYNGTQAIIYVDGAPDSVVDSTGQIDVSTYSLYLAENSQARGRYFGGMLDEVRVYNKALSENQVRKLAGKAQASNPDPANGSTDAEKTPTLTWIPGLNAATANGHKVYYSTDQDAVANRTAPSVTLSTPSFTLPMTLDLSQAFYWAVDTVNGLDIWPGDLWTFNVRSYRTVDDMETYVAWNVTGNHIFEAWRDGEGNCQPGNGNQTGSTLTENTDMLYVLGGLQSMKYEFDNDGMVWSVCNSEEQSRPYYYSRIEAQTATLPSGIGSNWTVEGVKALQINFMGQTGNSETEPLWVQLQDSSKTYGTKVFYGDQEGEALADMNDPAWHQWDIDLADFNVNLSNVVSIVIGIGNEDASQPGGSGTIYVDEIRLYTPRCVPSRAKPEADFDNSCEVDYPDVAAMFDAWLLQSAPEISLTGVTGADVGDVNTLAGSFSDLGGGAYTVSGAGADIWGGNDAFHYVYKSLSGDGQMTIRVTDIAGPSTNEWRKAGVMIRETLDSDSNHAFMCITAGGGGGSSFQWRSDADGDNNNQDGPAGIPTCIRLLRKGDEFRAFKYIGGQWAQHGSPVTIPMAQNVLIGLAVTSHDYVNMATATFETSCSPDFVAIDLIQDDLINFEDYAALLDAWAEEVLWPSW